MKKAVFLGFLVLTIVFSFSGAKAATYTFAPNPTDLYDLDHYKYYTWGINSFILSPGETITSASITFNDIYDWTVETDILRVHLLDNAAPGVSVSTDNQITSDAFAGQGILIGTWTDPYGGSAHAIDLTFDIASAYFGWLADGVFGFGIDPDCHYYNNGVVAKIETSPVPEPATSLLLGVGLIGIAGFGRRAYLKR